MQTDVSGNAELGAQAPTRARSYVRRWRSCLLAAAILGALAVPASASASFTENAPFINPGGETFSCPSGIGLDTAPSGAALSVFVTDSCETDLEEFSPDGQSFAGIDDYGEEFCGEGEGGEIFESPEGVTVDPATGDIYVADTSNDRIVQLDPSGDFLTQLGGGGFDSACDQEDGSEPGELPGYFSNPDGLTVYGGYLYVADSGNDEIQEIPIGFDQPVSADVVIPAGGTQVSPADVAVDPKTGNVFVVDDQSDLVSEYNSAGAYVREFASGFADEPGPSGIAVDPVAGIVYVSDSGNGVVDSFDETTAAQLQQITGLGNPFGLAVDPVNHVLYVVDQANNTVLDYSFTPAPACDAQPSDTAVSGVAKSLALHCADGAGAPVTYALDAAPAHGTLSAFNSATGAVTYTPAAGYAGSDSFTFQAHSENGTSAPATVTITDAPNCAPETLSTGYEHSVSLTLVCSPASSYEIVTPAAHGSLTTPTAGGGVTYAPDSLFAGTDSFTYVGVSNGVTSAPATVTLDVGTSLPPPVEGQSANVYFSSGTVLIYLPGQTTAIPLLAGMQVPLGSIIDATNGRVGIFVEIDGAIQTADFFDGEFKLTQATAAATVLHRNARSSAALALGAHTILSLLGSKIPKVKCAVHPHSFTGTFTVVPTHSAMEALTAHLAKKLHGKGPTRQLWGSGHGNFTTVGNGSSASVRGTEWAIFDYPDGTLTFDFTDSVTVEDFHLHKTLIITAGHFYFAALGNLPRCK
jgi:DNA-binding beta-propeller fold protein YncE